MALLKPISLTFQLLETTCILWLVTTFSVLKSSIIASSDHLSLLPSSSAREDPRD